MEVIAHLNGIEGPVKVFARGNGNVNVSGRGSELMVAIRPSFVVGGGDYLVAVTNYNRCG